MSTIQKLIVDDLQRSLRYLVAKSKITKNNNRIPNDKKQARLLEIKMSFEEYKNLYEAVSSKSMTIDEMKCLDFEKQRLYRLWN